MLNTEISVPLHGSVRQGRTQQPPAPKVKRLVNTRSCPLPEQRLKSDSLVGTSVRVGKPEL